MLDFGFFKMPTDLFLLILAIFLIALQLLFCFKVKNKIIRIIPVGLFVALTAVFGVLVFVLEGWRSMGCFAFAIWSALMTLVCCIGWCVFGVFRLIQKRFRDRKTGKKILITSACSIIALAISVGVFWYCHPTHYKYNDRLIIGNTSEKITERYGEFYYVSYNEAGDIYCATYMIRDNTPEMIMSYDDSLWYEIYFLNGIAVRVSLREGYPGG